MPLFRLLVISLTTCMGSCAVTERAERTTASVPRPNFIIITTDDQRYDAMGCAGNSFIHTPNIDALAARGIRFTNAFVTLSICSPSRAACLTGRYGSANGVVQLGRPLNDDEKTFAHYLKQAGYRTGFVGKWHIGRQTPEQCGFDWSVYFEQNGPQIDRTVIEHNQHVTAKGFIEDYNASQAIRFLREHNQADTPFVLWLCTQVPHMTPERDWCARPETLARYDESDMPVPSSGSDDLSGKPPYLAHARSRVQGAKDGFNSREGIQRNTKRYYASITDLDTALGRVLNTIDALNLRDNTYIIFTSDNGWFLGEHGFTSKVLPYEESIRVPLIVAGPGIGHETASNLALNIDMTPTLLELANLKVPPDMHGMSLVPLLHGKPVQWRKHFLYEAPVSQLGNWPTWAVRTDRWKYIQTFDRADPARLAFEELYDLKNDPNEMTNLAGRAEHNARRTELTTQLNALRAKVQR